MSQTLPPVRLSPPSPLALKFINPLMHSLLQSPLGKRMDSLMLLRFEARRSHRLMSIPVSYHVINGAITMTSNRPWRLNFTGGAPVTVVHQGQVHRGRATLLETTPEEVGAAIRAALDHGDLPRSFGLTVAPGHNPTAPELAAIGLSLIRLDLEN